MISRQSSREKVIKRTFPPEKRPLMQSWALNQRRERFRDPRVREAIALCFDFEWTNEHLFYNVYARSQSCFNGSDFQASGLPTPDELKVLERYRGKLPDAIFGEAVLMPVSDGSGRDRKQFAEAIKLLEAAGFERKNGQFHDKDGSKFVLEILSNSEGFSRVYNPYVQKLHAVRHRCKPPACRYQPVPGTGAGFPVRHGGSGATVQPDTDPGIACRHIWFRIGQNAGQLQPSRHGRSVDRCADCGYRQGFDT
jgi:hypothetical protein